MSARPFHEAEQIAASGYQLQVEREDAHDGQPIYIAYVLEIPECVAQGNSPEQAMAELRILMVDVIAYMLESGLEAPSPTTRLGSATVQVGDSQSALDITTIARKQLVITGSHVLPLNRSEPHTSWAVASIPSRVQG